jgi:hypothetical protein
MADLVPGLGLLAVEIACVGKKNVDVHYKGLHFIADLDDVANVFHPEDGVSP